MGDALSAVRGEIAAFESDARLVAVRAAEGLGTDGRATRWELLHDLVTRQ